MDVFYGINTYDHEGEIVEECIYIYIDKKFILRFEDMDELDDFIETLQKRRDQIVDELKDIYDD